MGRQGLGNFVGGGESSHGVCTENVILCSKSVTGAMPLNYDRKVTASKYRPPQKLIFSSDFQLKTTCSSTEGKKVGWMEGMGSGWKDWREIFCSVTLSPSPTQLINEPRDG